MRRIEICIWIGQTRFQDCVTKATVVGGWEKYAARKLHRIEPSPHHSVGGLRADPGGFFDYLLAVLPEFGLSLYQQPSGNDLRAGILPAVMGASQLPAPESRSI